MTPYDRRQLAIMRRESDKLALQLRLASDRARGDEEYQRRLIWALEYAKAIYELVGLALRRYETRTGVDA